LPEISHIRMSALALLISGTFTHEWGSCTPTDFLYREVL
jgi:hypothetical protein